MPSPLPILYSFRRCPYAMRARFALAYSAIDYQHREVKLASKPQSLLNYSPKGTVPVLILPDGTVIDESLDIMHYACQQHDPDGWMRQSPADVQSLIHANDSGFTPILRRYKYFERHPEHSQDYYRSQAQEQFLDGLEQRLTHTRYFLGEHISIADVAIFPFIRQCAMVDQSWFDASDYIQLKQWLKCFLDHPLFKEIMVKHPIWEDE